MSKPRVLIQVRGGVAYVTSEPGVNVLLLDYDTDSVDADILSKDVDKEPCIVGGVVKHDPSYSGMDSQFKHFRRN